MKRLFMAAALAAGLMAPTLAPAQSVGLAARGGTFGLGGEVNLDVSRWVGFRAGLGAVPIQPEGEMDNVNYKIKPPSTLKNIGIDLYPTGSGFRLSGGLLFKHDVTMDATSSTSYEFDGQTYSGAQVGTVNGLVAWKSTSPYASFGMVSRGKGLGLSMDLGAVFMGEPTFTLTSKGGSLSGDATFQQHLRAAEQDAQTDAGKYLKILPIVSIGIRYGL